MVNIASVVGWQVDWDKVAPEAEISVALRLTSLWRAAVPRVQNATAVHLFGVPQGQCPPGTYLRGAAAPASAPSQGGGGPTSVHDTRLAAMSLAGPNGEGFELSTAFSPGTTDYGTSVPPTITNATLCLQAMQGASALKLALLNLDVWVLPDLHRYLMPSVLGMGYVVILQCAPRCVYFVSEALGC